MFSFVSVLLSVVFCNSLLAPAIARAEFLAATSIAPPAPRVVIGGDGQFDTVDSHGRSCEKKDPTCREDLIHLKGTKIPLFISQRALTACSKSSEELAAEIQRLTNGTGKVMSTLRKAFDDFPFLDSDLDVIVVIDHLGSTIEKSRSFYLRDYPEKHHGRVVLDCQDSTRREWAALLAHEFTHVALERTYGQGESWLEEMIAQLLEVDAGGTQPERNLRVLEGLPIWPALSVEKPGEKILSPAVYAHSYLFGKYLLRNQGGWKFLKSLNAARLGDFGRCLELFSPFSCAVLDLARSGAFIENGGLDPYNTSAEELRVKFALATAFNSQNIPWLWIGGRFRPSTAKVAPVKVLGARQFYVVDGAAELPIHPKVSVFVLDHQPRFQNLKNAVARGWKKSTTPGRDRLLIINPTDQDLLLSSPK